MNLNANSGGTLALPSATSYSGGGTIQASGGTVDLSKLTTLTGASGYGNLAVNAYGGGKVDLSNITSQTGGRIYAHADGTGSIVDLSKLPELLSDAVYDSGLEASKGGSILTAPLPGDIANPETRPYVEKYMRTKPDVDGEYRTRLFHAARDITVSSGAGHFHVATLMGGGGLYAQKLVATMHYDLAHAKALAPEPPG